MTDNSPLSFTDVLNPTEIQSVGRAKFYNILTGSLAVGLFSYYTGDSQNDAIRKAALMGASQLFGSTLVDVLERGGKLDRSGNPMMSNGVQALASGGFYSVIAIQGFQLPNFENKQFQEAVVGSLVGTLAGASVESMIRPN